MDVREELVPMSLRGMTYACRVLTPAAEQRVEPLVLVGGALQDMRSWPRLERRLTAHMTMVLMDLPGSGVASDLAASAGFDVLADAARHALDVLGLAQVNLLGTSYGAAIAYRLAQTSPERVARLLLAGTTPRVNPQVAGLIRDGLYALEVDASGRAADLTTAVAGVPPGCPTGYARQVVGMLLNAAERHRVTQADVVSRLLHREFARLTRREALRHAACHARLLDRDLIPPGGIPSVPALVFTGEHDSMSTPAENRAVAASIPNSTFVLVRNADHMLHLEREAEYADLVTRFVRDGPLRDLPYCTPPERPGAAGGVPPP